MDSLDIFTPIDLNIKREYDWQSTSWWLQFISEKEFNSIHKDHLTSIRLAFEGLELPLRVLKIKGIDEVARNADGTLWGYGPFFEHGKGIIRTKYDLTDMLNDQQCTKAFKALSDYAGTVIHDRKNIFECDIPFLGYRFAATGAPLDIGPSFNMRKKATTIYTLDDYVEMGTLTESQRASLNEAVRFNYNILIVGSTGSGKTTFANAIFDEIAKVDPTCRCAIIEETSRELQCKVRDTVSLLIPPTRLDGKDIRIDAGDLLKGILRRTPNRISLGEVRDGAAVYLLQAWNSGHSGGICTIHADSAMGGLRKFEQYLETGGWKVSKALIADNIHVVVSLQKKSEIRNGKYVQVRKVEEIYRVDKFKEEIGDYTFTALQ